MWTRTVRKSSIMPTISSGLRWDEATTSEHWARTTESGKQRGYSLPVSEAYARFHAPARFGDLVTVRTQRGSVPFRARVTEDIVQGAIECSQGGGTPVGPKAWQLSNVNELTDIQN